MNQCQTCGGYFGVHRGWCTPATRAAEAQLQQQPDLSTADADVLHRAGLTLPQWQALTADQRADLRWRLGA